MAEDTSDTTTRRPGLAQAHPDVAARYERLNALFFEAREARRTGGAWPEASRTEALDLLRWADEVATEFLGDPEARQGRLHRDEAAFALALRLKDDGLIARQVLAAAEDLRATMGLEVA